MEAFSRLLCMFSLFSAIPPALAARPQSGESCPEGPAALASGDRARIQSLLLSSPQVGGEAQQWMACLQSLQKQPGIPPEKARRYWNTIDGKKTFGMRCNPMKTPDSFIYGFISEDGFRSVEYPRIPVKTKYSWGTETPIYPAKVATFKSHGTLYYINMETNDMFNAIPESALTSSAPNQLEISAATVKSQMANYEKALREKGLSLDFELTGLNPALVKACVSGRISDFINLMLSPAFNSWIPPRNSPTADWAQVKADIRAKVLAKVPECSSVVDAATFAEGFRKAYGK